MNASQRLNENKAGVRAQISSYDPETAPAKEQSLTTIPPSSLKVEIGVLDETKPANESLDSWLASLPAAPPQEWVKFRKPVVIAGIDRLALGIEKKVAGQVAFSSVTVYIPRGETVLFIYSVPNPQVTVHEKTYELMLNSLQVQH